MVRAVREHVGERDTVTDRTKDGHAHGCITIDVMNGWVFSLGPRTSRALLCSDRRFIHVNDRSIVADERPEQHRHLLPFGVELRPLMQALLESPFRVSRLYSVVVIESLKRCLRNVEIEDGAD